jgi:hypothetical protein
LVISRWFCECFANGLDFVRKASFTAGKGRKRGEELRI